MKKVFICVISFLIGVLTLFTSLYFMLGYIKSNSDLDMKCFVINIVITIIFGAIYFKYSRSKEMNNVLTGRDFLKGIIGICEMIKTMTAISFIAPPDNNFLANYNEALVMYLCLLLIQISIVWKREFLINILKD